MWDHSKEIKMLVCWKYWRRQWHPTPVLLPGKPHGWRSLVGCSPWDRWGSDMTEQLHFHALEKEMATHSSVLAWRIPGTGEPGGLPSMGWRRVGHNWSELAAAAAAAFAESCFSRTKPMLSKLMLRDIFKTHLFSKISLTIVINSDHTILFNEKIHYVDPILIMTWLKWGAVKKN